MNVYLNRLIDNGVESFDIFKGSYWFHCLEIRQKELEEIGVPKGHALKIVVNLKKNS